MKEEGCDSTCELRGEGIHGAPSFQRLLWLE
jgi:hypothetical protein